MPIQSVQKLIYRQLVQRPRVSRALDRVGNALNRLGAPYSTGLTRHKATLFASNNPTEITQAKHALSASRQTRALWAVDNYDRSKLGLPQRSLAKKFQHFWFDVKPTDPAMVLIGMSGGGGSASGSDLARTRERLSRDEINLPYYDEIIDAISERIPSAEEVIPRLNLIHALVTMAEENGVPFFTIHAFLRSSMLVFIRECPLNDLEKLKLIFELAAKAIVKNMNRVFFLFHFSLPTLFREYPPEVINDLEKFKLIFELATKAEEKGFSVDRLFHRVLPAFFKKCPPEIINDLKRLHSYLSLIFELGIKATGTGFHVYSLFYFTLPAFFEKCSEGFFASSFVNFFSCASNREAFFFAEALSNFNCLQNLITLDDANCASPQALQQHLAAELQKVEIVSLEDIEKYQLDKLSVSLLEQAGLREKISALLLQYFPSLVFQSAAHNPTGFVRAAISLLKHKDEILEDPNVLPLFAFQSQCQTLAAYYRAEKAGVLAEISAAGFDVDYLLSDQTVAARSLSEINGSSSTSPWPERLKSLVLALLGTKENPPAQTFPFTSDWGKRRKIFAQIEQNGQSRLALAGDSSAAVAVIDILLLILSHTMNMPKHQNLRRRLEEFHDLFSGLKGELTGGAITVVGKIYARRSPKLLPETLFDNQRLGCCIFKPDGMANKEISLILFDPTTPLLEFWLEGYPEFMAVATQYLGRNPANQPVVFVDTFESNQAIYSMGRNFGLKFVVDSLVLDAKKLGAKQVAIYQCPYGKALEFVNFVKELAGKNGYREVITEQQGSSFEAVDVLNSALSDSQGEKHHYTDAFGENTPLQGKINCWVIDVDQYFERCLERAA